MKRKTIQSNPLDALSGKSNKKHIDTSNKMVYAKSKVIVKKNIKKETQLMAKDGKFVTVKLPSGETRMILSTCYATVGSVSNSDLQLTVYGKAGSKRWLGRRPRTRPVAMNPVDHPMGGGEGRASGGHPRSKNGIPAKGFRTRDKKKASNKYIIERKKK